ETRSLYQNAINVNADIAQRVLDKRYKPSLMKPMTNEVIAAQQQIADRFTTDQVIPQHIDVKQAVWQGQ
ncbi:aliphatic sulfonates ABC transporter substrate-binding protein, partial [Acinetobacter nectaris]|nr:aliphatic sulfonates ABC transporter substrate-binding protein [Acinetobacter nectaris]